MKTKQIITTEIIIEYDYSKDDSDTIQSQHKQINELISCQGFKLKNISGGTSLLHITLIKFSAF